MLHARWDPIAVICVQKWTCGNSLRMWIGLNAGITERDQPDWLVGCQRQFARSGSSDRDSIKRCTEVGSNQPRNAPMLIERSGPECESSVGSGRGCFDRQVHELRGLVVD